MKNILVFDLDKTLINIDCENFLVNFLIKKKIIKKEYNLIIKKFYKSYIKGNFCIKKYYIFFSSIINKILNNSTILNEYLILIKKKANNQIFDIIKKKKNSIFVLSTSSCDFLSGKIFEIFKLDKLFSTSLEKKGKIFTGKINGIPNIGNGKVKNLLDWIYKENIKYKKIFFYSDSINDLPLFIKADRSFGINSDKYLKQVKKEFNIKILS